MLLMVPEQVSGVTMCGTTKRKRRPAGKEQAALRTVDTDRRGELVIVVVVVVVVAHVHALQRGRVMLVPQVLAVFAHAVEVLVAIRVDVHVPRRSVIAELEVQVRAAEEHAQSGIEVERRRVHVDPVGAVIPRMVRTNVYRSRAHIDRSGVNHSPDDDRCGVISTVNDDRLMSPAMAAAVAVICIGRRRGQSPERQCRAQKSSRDQGSSYASVRFHRSSSFLAWGTSPSGPQAVKAGAMPDRTEPDERPSEL